MNIIDTTGWIAFIFLVISMSRKDLKTLRIFNFISTFIYLIQSLIMGYTSLIVTDLVLLIIVGSMLYQENKNG